MSREDLELRGGKEGGGGREVLGGLRAEGCVHVCVGGDVERRKD